MNIIDIDSAIENALKRYRREAVESELYVGVTGYDTPYLYIKDWNGLDGMNSYCEEDADNAASALHLDDDLAYAWCTGMDGYPTLCAFESTAERDVWVNQR